MIYQRVCFSCLRKQIKRMRIRVILVDKAEHVQNFKDQFTLSSSQRDSDDVLPVGHSALSCFPSIPHRTLTLSFLKLVDFQWFTKKWPIWLLPAAPLHLANFPVWTIYWLNHPHAFRLTPFFSHFSMVLMKFWLFCSLVYCVLFPL